MALDLFIEEAIALAAENNPLTIGSLKLKIIH
jgi:hypothetical protein